MKADSEPGYAKPPVVVTVTPEMAMRWLEANTHNRQVHTGTVEKYARDMKLGRWLLTHQGIAFDIEGRLVDGQHRLWAVIESGCPVMMLVHHGLPMASQAAIDTHKSRLLVDRLGLSDRFGNVTSAEANTLKRLVRGAGPYVALSCQDEADLFGRHHAAIRFAISAFPGRRAYVTRSETYAVAARAYYNSDRDAIKRFCYVLFSNEAKTAVEKTALLLRDFLLASKGAGSKLETIYLKTEQALRSFIDGKKLTRIYPATEELFLLPEEKGKVKRYTKRPAKNFDAIDRVMAKMREQKTATTSALAIALGVKATHTVKLACDECVRLGWLRVAKAPKNAGRTASTEYTLVT